MSGWDYVLPHRLLLNKSLRKEAEELRARVASYQVKYENKIDECQEELNRIGGDYSSKEDKIKMSLLNELQQEKNILETIAEDITLYVDTFLYYSYLEKIREIKKKQIDILNEEDDFLSSQMVTIGKEIDILSERQDELTRFTNVDDIICLANLSDYDLHFNSEDDAKSMLDKVSDAISECGEDKKIEKYALQHLKGIIQERSEYLPTIKYIEWVIRQKKRFSRKLSENRKEVREQKKTILEEIAEFNKSFFSTKRIKNETAQRIRYYWAKPITVINVDLSYAYKEKGEAIGQIKDVGEDLHNMARRHSDSTSKWNRLQGEREELSENINLLRITIDSKKAEREQWFSKRDYVLQLCNKYDVPLVQENKFRTDEECIIDARLGEISEIRKEGIIEAEKVCEQERLEIISRYESSRKELEGKKEELIRKKQQAEKNYKEAEIQVENVLRKIKKLKDGDSRFFLLKFFSDTPEIEAANKELLSVKQNALKREKEKNEAGKKVQEVLSQMTEIDKKHESDLNLCKPRYLRPNGEECYEERKLLFRKEEIVKRYKEQNDASKNRFSIKPSVWSR